MTLAIVTGASSGIGESYARAFAARGHDLVVIGRRRDRLTDLATTLQRASAVNVEVIVADLTEREDVLALANTIRERPVDVLVNNAGLARYMPFTVLPALDAAELVDVNVTAPLLLTAAVLPGMTARASGAIVNIASLLAFSATAAGPRLPDRAVYAATKAFLVTHTRLLAAELAGSGVVAQVVCPGVVATEFHSRQGIDLSAVPRMSPDDLVAAALRDLDNGVTVSIPGLEDLGLLAECDQAAQRLLGAAGEVQTASRYRSV